MITVLAIGKCVGGKAVITKYLYEKGGDVFCVRLVDSEYLMKSGANGNAELNR